MKSKNYIPFWNCSLRHDRKEIIENCFPGIFRIIRLSKNTLERIGSHILETHIVKIPDKVLHFNV